MVEVCGTGLGNFPQPGDPDLTNSVLSASPRAGGIYVTWTYPVLLAHAVAHTLLFRSTTNYFSPEVEAAPVVVTGSYYFDTVTLVVDTEYFYWIKIISVNGTAGPLIGPVSAVMQPTVDYIIDTLVGQINDSQLTSTLRSRIDEVDNFALALLAESGTRVAGNTLFTALLAQYTSDLAAVDTLLVNEITTRATANSALVAQIDAILVTANGNTAAIITESDARVVEDTALATSLTALYVQVAAGAASVITEATARITADDALASEITTLVAQMGTDIAAAVLVESNARATLAGSVATDITNVSAAYAAADTVNSAAIINESTARANADSALSTSVSTLNSTVGGFSTSIQTLQTTSNGLSGEYSVRIDSNGYVAGFGLLNAGTSAEFIINANKFAVITPGNTKQIPFIIGTVNGVQTIALNAATMIPDVTISNAKISNGAITTAKIGSLQVDSLNIAGNAVTVPNGASGNINVTLNQTYQQIGSQVRIAWSNNNDKVQALMAVAFVQVTAGTANAVCEVELRRVYSNNSYNGVLASQSFAGSGGNIGISGHFATGTTSSSYVDVKLYARVTVGTQPAVRYSISVFGAKK